VEPEFGDFMRRTNLEILLSHQETLDDTRHVTEVELLEEFSRCRTELGFDEDLLEDAVESFDTTISHALYLLVELAEVVGQDALEDAGYGVIRRLGDCEGREEPLHAVGDEAGAHFRIE